MKGEAGFDYEVVAYVFGQGRPVNEWLCRLGARPGKNIPLHVLISMAKSFEYPTSREVDTIIEVE